MNLWFDLKYAWRLLLKSPGHLLLCIVVIGLSVGLALWAYVIVDGALFKPLGYPGSERWYSLQVAIDAKAVATPNVDAFTHQEVTTRSRSVNFLGAFANRAVVLSEGQASASLRAAAISPRLLAATQTTPHIGRLFDEADSKTGAASVVILSFNTWKNYFAADPAIVGKQTRIDSHPATVVGVMPKDFFAFQDFEVWSPLQLPKLARPGDSKLLLSSFAIIEKNHSVDAALNELEGLVADINKNHPTLFNAGRHVELIPGHRWSSHGAAPIMAMIVFIGMAVLLLGCTNISMVFLARFLERSRELALRTALGASRVRLLRQCLLETAFVVLFGMLLGCGLAALGLRWAQEASSVAQQILAQGRSPSFAALQASHVVAAVIIATMVWLLSTLIPAWRVAKQDAVVALSGSGKSTAGPNTGRTVRVVVGLQVIVSCSVLLLCAVAVFAVKEEMNRPSGFNSTHVMISTYPTIIDARYSQATERLRYWDELSAAAKSRLAGTEIAYATTPPAGSASVSVAIESEERSTNSDTLKLPLTTVSEEYFSLLGLQLRSGRLFDSRDNSTSLPVTVVDENTAKRYWPNGNVLGQRIQLNSETDGEWMTIIGVVSHVSRLYSDGRGVIYRPMRQVAPTSFHLLVRSSISASDSKAALRAAAFAIDRDLPLHNLQTLDDYLNAINVGYAMFIPGLSVIAMITAILAASGLFGLISRSVAQRTQEVGVRRALGATQWQVTAVFMRQGVVYLSIGIVGIGLGIVVSNFLSTVMTNVLDHVVLVTLGVLLLMALVIFTASYLPTRRAVALEPGDALRYE